MTREDIIRMAREAGFETKHEMAWVHDWEITPTLARFAALVRADERNSFYKQDKPSECAEGCPPKQICDYCQLIAPVKAMILAEREACAKVCDLPHGLEDWEIFGGADGRAICNDLADAIRARSNT